MSLRLRPLCLVTVTLLSVPAAAAAQDRIPLAAGWQLQSSTRAGATGDAISTAAFTPRDWLPATVPATVLAALVAHGDYGDPYAGMNLRAIPGMTYAIGRNFSNLPMAPESPFHVGWWYRASFDIPPVAKGRHLTLHLDGVNYRADVWLNGRRLASAADIAGTYRLFELDVTDRVKAGVDEGANILAIEVFPPEPEDLAWTWVDWNPAPPDKNMGLWRPVYLTTSGDVAVRHPMVSSEVDAAKDVADLTVAVEATNLSAAPVAATIRARAGAVALSQRVDLAAHERTVVRFTPAQFPALHVTHPALWWPADLGTPTLQDLTVEAAIGGSVSDRSTSRFGIRQITSELTPSGGRLFKVNGRPILIRGGGWAPDMLLRENPARQDAEFRYVRDMHLNTIRLEGKLEDERFFDVADREGILILTGWCCCDRWEQWPRWSAENHAIAEQSQRDQVCRLRGHPSVLAWLNGSDNPPPAEVERTYVAILKELDWPNPYVSSATARRTAVTGATGVKMTGPYDWVPPSYWLMDATHGGARGFNTETSPGPAVPPIESLRRMLGADHLWPIDDVWNFHAGGGSFKNVQIFTDAMAARYGPSTSVEDFARTSQLMTYDGERAMFEAYARNKYESTGVIQWMLNNAWPSLIWHLYDYYLRPGGGYFGTKKACEPVHVQYSYDDRSVVVVTNGPKLSGVQVAATVLGLDASVKFKQSNAVDVPADGVVRALTIPADIPNLPVTYFLDLRLSDGAGKPLSTNFYWLSTKPDVFAWDKSSYFVTPLTANADLTALRTMPAAQVQSSVRFARTGDREEAHVTLTNSGAAVAFFLRLQVVSSASGDEILPVLWSDNYVSLMPGERREVTATYAASDVGRSPARLVLSGWNVK